MAIRLDQKNLYMKPEQDVCIQLHQEYREWLSLLDFYDEEIRIFNLELEEVSREHPALLSILEHVEEYTHILERKKARISAFRTQLHHVEQAIQNQRIQPETHRALGSAIRGFSNDLEEMKQNFRRFVAHND